MTSFVLIRLLRASATLAIVLAVAFFVLRLSGDAALETLSIDAPSEALSAFRAHWGLDEPLSSQFISYVRSVLTGDFGRSMRDGRPAAELVAECVPITLAITFPALLLGVALGAPAGVYAALRPGTGFDRCVMLAAVAGFSTPSFVLGLVLVWIFSVSFGWLPSGGATNWRHAVLPILTLAPSGAGTLARFIRNAMLDVLSQEYIRTATAKGVPWRRIVLRHALPNAAIPTVTVMGFMIGQLIAGSVVVESVFSWPGVGRLLAVSVASRDFAVVQCVLLLVTLTMITANMSVDLLYAILDPRMRRERATAR
ncbi:ABC transporter permease [Methylosinus sp. Sm6]|uniref:ABC transporter permease n=1 Tax=Methylosinus sp. Sm6 TaxID=2866948 RepID=UPI001C99E9EE|nr:ABC transporter permease [Methylosinus sp. Sm6]MBY6241520.1 ABC transporter permease [Methylosinus sp. Sm6]